MCPQLCSQTVGNAFFSCSNHSPNLLCQSKMEGCSSFQCLLVPPITSRIRTSPFLIAHVAHPQENAFTSSNAPPVARFPPSSRSNLASEPEKTLKYCIFLFFFFSEDFFRRCEDICTYLPVPCFSHRGNTCARADTYETQGSCVPPALLNLLSASEPLRIQTLKSMQWDRVVIAL